MMRSIDPGRFAYQKDKNLIAILELIPACTPESLYKHAWILERDSKAYDNDGKFNQRLFDMEHKRCIKFLKRKGILKFDGKYGIYKLINYDPHHPSEKWKIEREEIRKRLFEELDRWIS